jgi:hypothetical protein
MNVLERNAWFGPLDKIFVPKWEWREIPELGMETSICGAGGKAGFSTPLEMTNGRNDRGIECPSQAVATLHDDIDSRGNPSLSPGNGSAILFNSG